jgi:hypothetical protein
MKDYNKMTCPELKHHLYDWNAVCPDDAVVGIAKQAKHQLVMNCYNRNWNSIVDKGIRSFYLSRNLADAILFSSWEDRGLKAKYEKMDYIKGFYEYLEKPDEGECRIRWWVRDYSKTDIIVKTFTAGSPYSAFVKRKCDDVFDLYFE